MRTPAARGALYVCGSSSSRLLGRPRSMLPSSRRVLAFDGRSPRLVSALAASARQTLKSCHLSSSSPRYYLLSSAQRACSTRSRAVSSPSLDRVRRADTKARKCKRLHPAYFTSEASGKVKGLLLRLKEVPSRLLKRCKSFLSIITNKVRGCLAPSTLAALKSKVQSKLWYLLGPALVLALWPKTVLNQEPVPSAPAPEIHGEDQWLDEDIGKEMADDSNEELAEDASEDWNNFNNSLELPSTSVLRYISGSPFSAAHLLRTSLLADSVDFRLRDGLLALHMTYNPLQREYISASIDTSDRRLSRVHLADIIEDLEAFDEVRYPHVSQKLRPTLDFLRTLLRKEEDKRLAAEARKETWESMNLVSLATRIPLSTHDDDGPDRPTPVLVWDLIVARTLSRTLKQAKLRLDIEKVYRGVVRFTDERAAHLQWKPLSASLASSVSASPSITSLLPAVPAGQGDVQEQLAVLLDVAGGEHVAAVPRRQRDEGVRGEASLRALLAASLVAQICAYLIFTAGMPSQMSRAA